MILSLVLIEGDSVSHDALRTLSLGNALQIVFEDSAPGFGRIAHINADSATDFSNAIGKFAQVPGVTGVLTLAIKNQ